MKYFIDSTHTLKASKTATAQETATLSPTLWSASYDPASEMLQISKLVKQPANNQQAPKGSGRGSKARHR